MNQILGFTDWSGAQILPGEIVTARKQVLGVIPGGGQYKIPRGTAGIVEDFIPAEKLIRVGFEWGPDTTISVQVAPDLLLAA